MFWLLTRAALLFGVRLVIRIMLCHLRYCLASSCARYKTAQRICGNILKTESSQTAHSKKWLDALSHLGKKLSPPIFNLVIDGNGEISLQSVPALPQERKCSPSGLK